MLRTFEDSLSDIKIAYDNLRDALTWYREKMAEYNKDEEIQKYKGEIEYFRNHSLKTLSNKELKDVVDFRNQHRHSNSFSYTLTGTGIGTAIVVTCEKCGESKNITDYDAW